MRGTEAAEGELPRRLSRTAGVKTEKIQKGLVSGREGQTQEKSGSKPPNAARTKAKGKVH